MFLLRFTVAPISMTLTVLERQDLGFFFSMVRFVVTIGGLLIASWLSVAPQIVVLIYSVSMGIVELGQFALMVYALRKHGEGERRVAASISGRDQVEPVAKQ